MDWRHDALCADTDFPNLWFPEGRTAEAAADAADAKEICHRCTVAGDCLAHSFTVGATDGIFGGYDPDERRELHGQRLTMRLKAGR